VRAPDLVPWRRPAPFALAALGGLFLACSDRPAERPAVDARTLERLEALGYVAEVPTEQTEEGVVIHDPGQAFPGLNCFASRRQKRAVLMDMEGRILHTWKRPRSMKGTFGHVELADNGDLVALRGRQRQLCRLGWEGDLLWCLDARAHHDFDIDPGGDIHVLVSKPIVVTVEGRSYPVLDDRVVRVSPDGQVLEERLSLFELVGDRIESSRWAAISEFMSRAPEERKSLEEASATLEHDVVADSPYDVFHTNSIRIIDRDLPGMYGRGDLLLSVRELDLVLVVDPRTGELKWEFGPGMISRQHDATLLENGNVLLFDNGRASRRSRVIEVDPRTQEIVWSYDGTPGQRFYSAFRGAAQRLPNGNTLITGSARGRAFEVTSAGEIVWTYYTPKTGEKTREVVYNVARIGGHEAEELRRRASRQPPSLSGP
jgi:hypothetical protein